MYTAMSLTPNTTYYFEIVAADTGHDDSTPSVQIAVTTLPLPAAPAVAATVNSATRITIAWSETIPPSGLPIQYYNVFRGTSPSGMTQVTTRTASPYIDMAAAPNTTYYYAVQAVDTGKDPSSMSAAATAKTSAMPAAPVVAASASSTTKVTATWTESLAPNGLAIQYYNVFRGTSPGSMAQVATRTASPYIDTTVAPNTNYYYAIEAVDAGGDVSPMSATAVTPN